MRSFFPRHIILTGLLVMAALWSLSVSCGLKTGLRGAPTSAAKMPTAAVTAIVTATAGAELAITLPVEPSATAPQPTQTSAPPLFPTPDHLTSQAPWLVVSTSNGIWAANPDGSWLTQLSKAPIASPYSLAPAIAPGGTKLAYVTSSSENQYVDLALHLLDLTSGKDTTITALTSPTTAVNPQSGPGDKNYEVAFAMVDLDSLAWSPDGSMLAFVGAQEGSSADIYSYIPATGKINHLTSGPSQAFAPSWSPDSKYIVQFGASSFGTGAGYSMSGAWAVRASDGSVITLYTPNSGGEELIGWLDPTTFLVYSWTMSCAGESLRSINFASLAQKSIYTGCFSSVAMDPDSKTVLLAGEDPSACSCSPGTGAFLLPPGTLPTGSGTPKQVLNDDVADVQWLKEGQVFLARVIGGEWVGIKPDGTQAFDVPAANDMPAVAPGGQVAWTAYDPKQENGVWVQMPGNDPKKIFDQPAHNPVWSSEKADVLLFFAGSDLYAAHAPDFMPVKMGQVTGDVKDVAIAK